MAPIATKDARFYCYKLTCLINGKCYIGIVAGSPQRRLNQHRNAARSGARTPLHQAMRKHGFENFVLEVLTEAPSSEEVCDFEREFIKKYGTLAKNGRGYNLATGGQGPFGVERDSATREKLRRITKRWLEEDPTRLERLVEAGRRQASDPRQREISRQGAREAWQRPGYREAVSQRVKAWAAKNKEAMSKNQKEVMARPGTREILSGKAKAQMRDPHNRELSRQGALRQWEDEAFRGKMGKQMQDVGRRNWKDPHYRQKMREACSKPVVAAGVRYASLNEAASALGIRPNSLIYRLKNDRYPDYYYERQRKYVMVAGVKYPSVNAAAKALDITHPICLRRIRSPDFPEYQIVDELYEPIDNAEEGQSSSLAIGHIGYHADVDKSSRR